MKIKFLITLRLVSYSATNHNFFSSMILSDTLTIMTIKLHQMFPLPTALSRFITLCTLVHRLFLAITITCPKSCPQLWIHTSALSTFSVFQQNQKSSAFFILMSHLSMWFVTFSNFLLFQRWTWVTALIRGWASRSHNYRWVDQNTVCTA